MDHDDATRIDCPCMESVDPDGIRTLIPDAECDLHWHQVINADLPPAHLFP